MFQNTMQAGSKNESFQRCDFFDKKRNRSCQVLVAKGFQYCGDHALRNNLPMSKPRVECPLDPKHSVFVHKLAKHLKICNSRAKEKPVYFEQNVNIDTCDEIYTGKKELASFTPEEVRQIVAKAEAMQQAQLLESEVSIRHHDLLKEEIESETNGPSARKHLEQLSSILGNMENANFFNPNTCFIEYGAGKAQLLESEVSIRHHDLLKEEIESETNGPSARKHLEQLSSILGNMENANFFNPNTCFIEYGAGKGRLSQWIFDIVANYQGTHFILVDRKNVRHKRDLYHKDVRQNLSMERLLIDIQDLVLSRVRAIQDHRDRPIVAHCKHLCGAATDLALRSLFPSLQKNHQGGNAGTSSGMSPVVKGVAMATCCHHRCSWESYVGKEFLSHHGFSRTEFEALIRMSSWCVCGRRPEHNYSQRKIGSIRNDQNEVEEKEEEGFKETLTSALGLTIPEREKIGQTCKRVLDAGRLDFLRKNGVVGKLVRYIEADITLENILILAKRTEESNDSSQET